jgi:putative aminopeptidase FrvX
VDDFRKARAISTWERHLDDKAGVAAMFAALKAPVDTKAHLAVDTPISSCR